MTPKTKEDLSMITANEARANVMQYNLTVYEQVKIVADELLETMSKSIAFHSKSGFDYADFVPYGRSQFTSEKAMQIASTIFERAFKDNGFKVIENDWARNVLKIKW